MTHTRSLFLLFVSLFLLSACKVNFDGFDSCVKELEVTITQGTSTQSATVPMTAGKGGVELDSGIDATQDLVIEAKVKSVNAAPPACREKEAMLKTGRYRFGGTLPVGTAAETTLALPAGMTHTTPTRPQTGGHVEGGTVPPPRARGTGGLGVSMWSEGVTGCTALCWEQWISTRLYLDKKDGNGFKEKRNGRPWTDLTGHAQVYGRHGRDLPPGSTGNCFRLDPVPGKPGQTGIVDMPGYDTNTTTTGVYRFGRDLAKDFDVNTATWIHPPAFGLRYDFDVYSVLICTAPAPRRTIGSYHWSAQQTFEFTQTATGSVRTGTAAYSIPMSPQWSDGRGGLPAGVTAP